MIDAPSTRRRLAVVCLGLFALIIAACGTLDGDAANVGGTSISDDDVRAELELAAEFAELNPGTEAENFARSGDATFSMESATFQLDRLIQSEAYDQILDELGGEVTPEDRDPASGILSAFENNGWLDGFVDGQSKFLAVQRILQDEVELSFASPEEWFEGNRVLFENVVCARHILVATPEEAEAAYARIVDGGEAFEDVAADVGTDGTATQGGNLGCQPPETYVEAFAIELSLLTSGELSVPFPTEFGWHIARVDKAAGEVDFDDVADQANAQYQAQVDQETGGAIQLRLTELYDDLDISVSSRYGIWDDVALTVIGPGAG